MKELQYLSDRVWSNINQNRRFTTTDSVHYISIVDLRNNKACRLHSSKTMESSVKKRYVGCKFLKWFLEKSGPWSTLWSYIFTCISKSIHSTSISKTCYAFSEIYIKKEYPKTSIVSYYLISYIVLILYWILVE